MNFFSLAIRTSKREREGEGEGEGEREGEMTKKWFMEKRDPKHSHQFFSLFLTAIFINF